MHMTEQRLMDMVAAWQRADLDALMTFISDDCIYTTTAGTLYQGKEAVREGFRVVLSSGGKSDDHYGPLFIAGNRGALEWSSTSVNDAQERVTIRGCDLFEFAGDLVCRKEAFRKL